MKQKEMIDGLKMGLEFDGDRVYWSEFFAKANKINLKKININKYFNKSDVIKIASNLSVIFNKGGQDLFDWGVSLFMEWRPWIDVDIQGKVEHQDKKFESIINLRLKTQKSNKKAP